jgi:hypothetical protein
MSLEKLEQEKRRGDHAARLLNDELLNETLDAIEADTITLWENTPARDSEGREHLHRFYLACRKFRNTLKSHLETGKMASIQLERSTTEKLGLAWNNLTKR